MKRTLLITLGLFVLVWLGIQAVRDYITDFKNEHHWYLSQLNFEFSAEIDTVWNRHIVFHATRGNLNSEREAVVNTRLKHNGFAALFSYGEDNHVALMIDSAFMYKKGDSLYVNTAIDRIRIYRNHKILSEKSLVKSIRAKPYKDIF
jgi:hypothetical protein